MRWQKTSAAVPPVQRVCPRWPHSRLAQAQWLAAPPCHAWQHHHAHPQQERGACIGVGVTERVSWRCCVGYLRGCNAALAGVAGADAAHQGPDWGTHKLLHACTACPELAYGAGWGSRCCCWCCMGSRGHAAVLCLWGARSGAEQLPIVGDPMAGSTASACLSRPLFACSSREACRALLLRCMGCPPCGCAVSAITVQLGRQISLITTPIFTPEC